MRQPEPEWFDKTKKTPDIPLIDFVEVYDQNDAIWFRLGCGAQKQLFDKALKVLRSLEAEQLNPN